jgi:hypothetical protein
MSTAVMNASDMGAETVRLRNGKKALRRLWSRFKWATRKMRKQSAESAVIYREHELRLADMRARYGFGRGSWL